MHAIIKFKKDFKAIRVQRAVRALTTRPAFLTASGSPSSPVPMFPFNRWMSVWQKLGQKKRVVSWFKRPFILLILIIRLRLTRFPPALRSSRRSVAVWSVLEEGDKAHPFLTGFGRKTKHLPRRRKKTKQNYSIFLELFKKFRRCKKMFF